MTPEEFTYANFAFPWYHHQETPLGMLGAGYPWQLLDLRLARAEDEGVAFAGRRVLEVGCCDGHVTVGLHNLGAILTAFDGRLLNVLKTVTRLAAWGVACPVHLKTAEQIAELGTFDLIVHFGVLYHLPDPARHLAALATLAPQILLDTHTARSVEELISVDGYLGHWYEETTDLLAGLEPRSFWPTKDSLQAMISAAGFRSRLLAEDDKAVNGPRALHFLEI